MEMLKTIPEAHLMNVRAVLARESILSRAIEQVIALISRNASDGRFMCQWDFARYAQRHFDDDVVQEVIDLLVKQGYEVGALHAFDKGPEFGYITIYW